jgi:phage-related protein
MTDNQHTEKENISMGIRTFTFGGTSSGDYNMFITSASTYGAPERAVEMIEIPGRNGHYALDQGRFENVEVIYHVVVHDNNNTSFQSGMSDVRNWLCSQIGYQRLEDDYNTGEYRMAVYRSGLEMDGEDTFWNGAEFDIVFDCKPQRWLASGETAVSVANNGTLNNTTPFESRPLLQIWGYGDIQVNNDIIKIISEPSGTVTVKDTDYNTTDPVDFDYTYANTGDLIYETGRDWQRTLVKKQFARVGDNTWIENISLSYSPSPSIFEVRVDEEKNAADHTTVVNVQVAFADINFKYGTAKTIDGTVSFECTMNDTSTVTVSHYMKYKYDGSHSVQVTYTTTSSNSSKVKIGGSGWIEIATLYLDSTQTTLGTPLYFDLDIGEAYKIVNDNIVSVNSGVVFPPKLPTLKPGSNVFKYPNTITQFKVVPRWWKV